MKKIVIIAICVILLLCSLTGCGKKYVCSFCKETFRGEPVGLYTLGNLDIKFCAECNESLGSYYDAAIGAATDFFD